MKQYRLVLIMAMLGLLSGCAGKPVGDSARMCLDGLAIAERELEAANARGFGDSVDYTRAVSLIGAARLQSEFGKYPNCIDKVERARYYISQIGK
jgi:hypothetical protein